MVVPAIIPVRLSTEDGFEAPVERAVGIGDVTVVETPFMTVVRVV